MALFLFILFINFSTMAHASRLPIQKCKNQILEIANNWKATGEWNTRLKKNYYSETDKFGDWVFIRPLKKVTTVTKENQDRSIITAFDHRNCSRETRVIKKQGSRKPWVLNDKKLNSIIKQGRGIFYFISPSMPLSLKALKSISKTCREMRINLYVIIDPSYKSEMYADYIKVKYGIQNVFRTNSFEFKMRNTYIHFPMFLGYKNGKISKLKKFGYEVDFKKDIQDVLN